MHTNFEVLFYIYSHTQRTPLPPFEAQLVLYLSIFSSLIIFLSMSPLPQPWLSSKFMLIKWPMVGSQQHEYASNTQRRTARNERISAVNINASASQHRTNYNGTIFYIYSHTQCTPIPTRTIQCNTNLYASQCDLTHNITQVSISISRQLTYHVIGVGETKYSVYCIPNKNQIRDILK